ncbi:MAG: TlpA disulfide reductase family protein [Saprospiraceae bacterium]
MHRYFLFILCFLIINSCVEPIHKSFSKLPPGKWRAILKLDKKLTHSEDNKEYFEQFDFTGELPFNFEVNYTDEQSFYINIMNGEERIKLDNITYGRDHSTAKDTIKIDIPIFDSYIKGIFEENIIEGDWFVNYKNGYSIPFKAYYGKDYRFTTLKEKPIADVTGRWDVVFEPNKGNKYPAIGEFKQSGNHLTGTFLTETGDYRYLEGTIQGDKLKLSTFDGAHAFLFEAKFKGQNNLIGSFRSGKHYKSTWTATRNQNAKINDAFALTTSNIGEQKFDIVFPNLEGKAVTLNDEQFSDKVKLVKITGTWCPNCKDEALFLKKYLKHNPNKAIEVIEVAFERYKDQEKAIEILKRYKKKLDLPFTILYGGYANKKENSELFPQISEILSYPTLIFVDKQNIIRHIHTGFAGPATKDFKKFDKQFNEIIDEMLNNS